MQSRYLCTGTALIKTDLLYKLFYIFLATFGIEQCCGSGSASSWIQNRIHIKVKSRIRIRIRIKVKRCKPSRVIFEHWGVQIWRKSKWYLQQDPDLDPRQMERQDSDPDPHQNVR